MRYAAILALTASAGLAQVITPHVTVVDSNYVHGYRGVKYHLGHTLDGVSIHILPQENGDRLGTPDRLLWADSDGARILDVWPTTDASVVNPGGLAQFSDDGTVWMVTGGRADQLPFDLLHSGDTVLDDLVTSQSSTTPCFHPYGDDGLLLYRFGGSSWYGRVKVIANRMDLTGAAPVIVDETVIATGSYDNVFGKIGIEQLWTRHDPRYGTAATWQWWRIDPRYFGSNPFLWTDDHGVTWKDASGTVRDLPLAYADRDGVLVPIDHLEMGVDAEWQPRDLGWTPHGLPFQVLPDGYGNVIFCRWTGAEWDNDYMTGPVLGSCRPYAAGSLKDSMVVVYATADRPGDIYARASFNDGATWTAPQLVDSVGDDRVVLVSYCQPAKYDSNKAVFVIGHADGANAHQHNYEHAIRLLELDIKPPGQTR